MVFLVALRSTQGSGRRNEVFSNKMGYLGGVNFNISVALVCQLFPAATPSYLLTKFFHILRIELAVAGHPMSARGSWVWLRGLGPARGPITGAHGVRTCEHTPEAQCRRWRHGLSARRANHEASAASMAREHTRGVRRRASTRAPRAQEQPHAHRHAGLPGHELVGQCERVVLRRVAG